MKTEIIAKTNNLDYGQIQYLKIIKELELPKDIYGISGELIFEKFNDSHLAVTMRDFDIYINSGKYNLTIHNVSLSGVSQSTIRSGRLYKFKAKKISKHLINNQEDK